MPPTAPLESYTESGTCGSGASGGESAWAGLMKQVVSDSPEILSAGVGQLAGYAGQIGAATAAGCATTTSGQMGSGLQQPPPAAGVYGVGGDGSSSTKGSGIDGVPASVMQG